MSTLLERKKQLGRLRSVTGSVLVVLSGVIGLGVYHGLGMFAGNGEGDLFGELLKGSLAIGVCAIVWTIGKYQFDGWCLAEREQRGGMMVGVIASALMFLALSTYVLTATYGREAFTGAHFEAYLASAARDKDRIVTALRNFEAIAIEAESCAVRFEQMQTDEQNGAYSGLKSEGGPLQAYFGSFAGRCRSLAEQISAAGKVTTELLAKMDAGLAAQNVAADSTDQSIEDRVSAIRAGSEQFRGALGEAAARLPIGAVKSVGEGLRGAQAEPSLSSKPAVAAGQQRGISEARKVHEPLGANLLRKAAELEAALAAPPAAFALPSAAELPLKYWHKAIPIVAMCAAADLSLFLMMFFAARLQDAIRDQEQATEASAFEQVTELYHLVEQLRRAMSDQSVGLGPHPYRSATQARAGQSNGKAARPPLKAVNDEEDEE